MTSPDLRPLANVSHGRARVSRMLLGLIGLAIAGCGAVSDPGSTGSTDSTGKKSDTPQNVPSTMEGAAYCAAHVVDCLAQYPRCEPVVSPFYDETAAGGGRCMASTGHSDTSPYPIVQCVPRTAKEGYVEPTIGIDELIDPSTGHCVKIALHAGSPKWSPCEDFMPLCASNKGGACVPGEGASAGQCFTRCDTAADCSDPAKPHCSWMGQTLGGDYECNGRVRVCRADPLDEC